MKVEFIDFEHAAALPVMLNSVLRKVDQHIGDDSAKREAHPTCKVYCNPRNETGFVEWGLYLPYPNGGEIFIGVVQREPGCEVEFHS